MSAYLQGTDLAAKDKAAAPALSALRAAGEKITMLTCYDASFASLMDRCGVEVLLIGDSLGMVCNGHPSPLPVTVAELAYHTAAVARGSKSAMIVADLPFGANVTPETAFNNAVTLVPAAAHMIKIEGAAWLADTVTFLPERCVPVCAHLCLTPLLVHQVRGCKVEGKSIESA